MAEVVSSRTAWWAGVACHTGFDGYSVAELELVGVLSDTACAHHFTGGFVTQEEVVVDNVSAKDTMVPVMDLYH